MLNRTVIRTCIGCRERADIAELVRIVAIAQDGVERVVLDTARRLEGRGAWLHPGPDCAALAQRRNAFGRSLRRKSPVDTDLVQEQIARLDRHYTRRVTRLVSPDTGN
ncbi:MAG: YlxR family protein [Pseudonocardiaceae bacterium]